MSFSAHKTYGPKGIGALFVRRKPRVRIEAQIHGGGHERGMRSGTLATHQIVGMGEAFRIAREEMKIEKSVIHAFDMGYTKAKTAVLDANITTLIAAVILFAFGSGPVKGFAITLGIGIVTTLILVLGPKEFPIALKKIGSYFGKLKNTLFDLHKIPFYLYELSTLFHV